MPPAPRRTRTASSCVRRIASLARSNEEPIAACNAIQISFNAASLSVPRTSLVALRC